MPIYLVAIVALIYLGTSVSLLFKEDLGLSLMFFSYAVANVGLIISMRGIA